MAGMGKLFGSSGKTATKLKKSPPKSKGKNATHSNKKLKTQEAVDYKDALKRSRADAQRDKILQRREQEELEAALKASLKESKETAKKQVELMKQQQREWESLQKKARQDAKKREAAWKQEQKELAKRQKRQDSHPAPPYGQHTQDPRFGSRTSFHQSQGYPQGPPPSGYHYPGGPTPQGQPHWGQGPQRPQFWSGMPHSGPYREAPPNYQEQSYYRQEGPRPEERPRPQPSPPRPEPKPAESFYGSWHSSHSSTGYSGGPGFGSSRPNSSPPPPPDNGFYGSWYGKSQSEPNFHNFNSHKPNASYTPPPRPQTSPQSNADRLRAEERARQEAAAKAAKTEQRDNLCLELGLDPKRATEKDLQLAYEARMTGAKTQARHDLCLELGLNPTTATEAQIKRAYHQSMMNNHSDRTKRLQTGGNEDTAKTVSSLHAEYQNPMVGLNSRYDAYREPA